MPRGMSETEKLKWRDRSEHADWVWREKGLTGEGPANSEIRNTSTNLAMLLDAYRGNQWKHIGELNGIDWQSHLVINSVFSAANTFEAQLLSQLPSSKVFGKNPASVPKARNWKAILDWGISEIKFERAANAALLDAFFGFGVVRMGYTPREEMFDKQGAQVEFGSPTTADLPWLRRVAPWDIRIDPLAESWQADGDATWCEFIALYTEDQLKRMPGITVPKDLKATVSKDKREDVERRQRDQSRYEAANLVEVRTVYDLEERKWFQWSPGSRNLLREPADWPEVFKGLEGLPYALLEFNKPADDPCPIGYAEMMWPLQVERNKVRTMLSELVRRHRRIVIGNSSAFDEHERQKIADGDIAEMFWSQGDVGSAIAQIPVAGFDQGLLAYDQVIQEDIRETIGQSKLARAQRINVESATEAARVGAGDDLQAGRNRTKVHAWLKDCIRLFAKGIAALPDPKFLVPVLGQENIASLMAGQPQVLQLDAEQLQGEFDFDIEVGSNLPRDEKMEVAKALQWLQIATQYPQNANIPAALLELVHALGKDPANSLMTAEQIAATNQAMQQQPPVEQGAGQINPAPFLQGGGETVQ